MTSFICSKVMETQSMSHCPVCSECRECDRWVSEWQECRGRICNAGVNHIYSCLPAYQHRLKVVLGNRRYTDNAGALTSRNRAAMLSPQSSPLFTLLEHLGGNGSVVDTNAVQHRERWLGTFAGNLTPNTYKRCGPLWWTQKRSRVISCDQCTRDMSIYML